MRGDRAADAAGGGRRGGAYRRACAHLAHQRRVPCRGRYCTVYAAAAAACLGDGDFAPLADIALKMGASSGTDTLCGALAAAKLLLK